MGGKLLLLMAALRTFSIDGSASTATAHVGKTGIVGFAGHEHVVVARNIQGGSCSTLTTSRARRWT